MVNPVNRVTSSTGTRSAAKSSQPVSQGGKGGTASATSSSSQESVALSSKAQLAHDVSVAASQSQGVDSERIQAIREALSNNQYTVSPQEIARAVAEAAWLVNGK